MSREKYILVIADGSKEMEVALQYACARSKKTNRKIIIATFIEPLDVLTTQGVTKIMQNEAREEAEKNLKYAASIVNESTDFMPVLQLREGEIIKDQIKLQINKNRLLAMQEMMVKERNGEFFEYWVRAETQKGRPPLNLKDKLYNKG